MPANRLVLDLGCGKNKQAGAIGVDNVPLDTVDVVHDLRMVPYPFISGSVDEVILSHVLEHMEFTEILKILQEVMRILKPSGSVVVSVPHAGSLAAFTDPTHKTFFTFATFYYLTSEHQFSYYKDLSCKWKIDRLWASTNLFNNQFRQERNWQKHLNRLASKLLCFAVRYSKTMTFPEMMVKMCPFWLVSIHVRLSKG